MTGYANNAELQPGMDVVGSDGDKVGKIVSLDGNRIVVEKGFFFPSDYYIPMSAVASVDSDKVYLNVSKEEALNQQWDVDSFAASSATDAVRTGDASAYAVAEQARPVDTAAYADQTTKATDDLPLTIDVHEEELTATKHAVDAGEVVINKTVVSEQRTLDVPITEERVRVTRRDVDREDAGEGTAFQEGTIEVPVRTEQVDVQKRVRVGEEVEIAKEAIQKTQQVTGTVRREVVDVKDNTQVDVSDGTTAAGSVTEAAKGKGEDLLDRAADTARDATGRSKNKKRR